LVHLRKSALRQTAAQASCPTYLVAMQLALLASIEVHFPVDHIGHVATAIEKLHNFLARPCQFCPTRARIWVLLETPQYLVLNPEIHLAQFRSTCAPDWVAPAF
jgi:hypothetical protein